MGRLQESIQTYVEILKSGNYEQRVAALIDLRETKSNDSAIVDLFVYSIYNDPDGYMRILAAEALSKLNMYPEHALPVLKIAIETILEMQYNKKAANTDAWLRVTIGAIGNYEHKAHHLSDLLIRALFECDLNIAGYAAISLAKIGAKEAIPAMKKLIVSREVGNSKPILYESIEKLEIS